MKITAGEMRERTSITRGLKLELAKNKVLTHICDDAVRGNEFIVINEIIWLGDALTDRFVFNKIEFDEFIMN